MEDRNYHVKIAVQDTGCAEAFQNAVMANGRLTLVGRNGQDNPDLLIYELRDEPLRELQQVKGLIDGGRVKDAFIYSTSQDAEVLLKVIKIGLTRYFTNPLDRQEIQSALDGFVQRMQTADQTPQVRHGKIFNVIGSKGGVGTTTVAVNLAAALSLRKAPGKVALLDMNTLFGDIPLFMDLKSKFHWGEITKNIDRLDETFLMRVLDKHPTGVHVLSSPGYLNGHVEPTPIIMERLLQQMRRMFDFIIVDAGLSTNETALKITQMADTVFVISTLSLPCLANTNKLVRSYLNLGYADQTKIKIVVNRYLKKSEVSLKDAEEGINQELFWVVPNDYATSMSAINQGKTLVEQFPKAAIAKSFHELAAALSGAQAETRPARKWLLF